MSPYRRAGIHATTWYLCPGLCLILACHSMPVSFRNIEWLFRERCDTKIFDEPFKVYGNRIDFVH